MTNCCKNRLSYEKNHKPIYKQIYYLRTISQIDIPLAKYIITLLYCII